jgi:hypothetical protein
MSVPDDPRAAGSAEYFPGSNPHPVMRVTDDGRLTYANDASAPLLETMEAQVGEPLGPDWQRRLRGCAIDSTAIEAAVEERLRGRFVFDPRGLTEIRGKGPMATFFLTGETADVIPPVTAATRP